MRKTEDMKLYDWEEVQNELFGEAGTPERNEYEREVEEAIQSYHIGEAIKEARIEKKLTQQQLGELMGVKRAQVSRIEKGRNLTVGTIMRAFKAMNIPTEFSFGEKHIALS